MDTLQQNTAQSAEEAARIVPRAEFRVFGSDIVATVQDNMWHAKATLHSVRDLPEEMYFLAAGNDDANIKVRDGLLDIKVKIGETPEGYEIFQPRGKFRFPVSREDLQQVLAQLRTDVPLNRDSYTLEDFVSIARAHPGLAVVSVTKQRYGFSVEGVICEYARVRFNGALLESACCESEDYAAIQKVTRLLGIDGLRNTNYLKAAKQVIGMP